MRVILGIMLFFLLSPLSNAADFVLKSTGYTNYSRIPKIYSCDGKNIPPGLYWENAPADTKSFIILFYSPDTPQGTFYNWIVFNIPGTTTALPEDESLPTSSIAGVNTAGDNIYRGPCPPDSYLHHYIFDIYALDTVLDLSENAEGNDVLAAAHHHILKQARLDGIFSH